MAAATNTIAPPTRQVDAYRCLTVTPPVIHLIEDNTVIRDVESSVFEIAGWHVEKHFSAEEFLSAERPSGDTCLVVDISLPGISGLDLLEQLNTEGSRIPTIMLTGHNDAGLAIAAFKAGAADFLLKPADWEMLFASATDALKRFREIQERDEIRIQAKNHFNSLTPREREVMMMMFDGKPNKIIAYEMGISKRTVENHRANLMKKTEASSLPALVKLFLDSSQAD